MARPGDRRHLTLGKIMELVEPRADVVWPVDLFIMLVQTTPRLQPRYFSIASSPTVSKGKLTITVGVIVTDLPQGGQFYGLATNHLHALHLKGNSLGKTSDSSLEDSLSGSSVCMRIRPSNFKPPSDETLPVLMIAAGSGIAPFLAFAQEREALYKAGRKVGRMVLVFGCRSADQDYLYADEWARLQEYGFFTVYTAFSRSGPRKRYVQHVIEERTEEVRAMILEASAACYICGSINMATEVKDSLAKVLVGSTRTEEEARDYIHRMKSDRMLQEDVWA